MEISRPEHWKGSPVLYPADLPNPGIEPGSPALQVDSLSAELPGKIQGAQKPLEFRPPGALTTEVWRNPSLGLICPLSVSCLDFVGLFCVLYLTFSEGVSLFKLVPFNLSKFFTNCVCPVWLWYGSGHLWILTFRSYTWVLSPWLVLVTFKVYSYIVELHIFELWIHWHC